MEGEDLFKHLLNIFFKGRIQSVVIIISVLLIFLLLFQGEARQEILQSLVGIVMVGGLFYLGYKLTRK